MLGLVKLFARRHGLVSFQTTPSGWSCDNGCLDLYWHGLADIRTPQEAPGGPERPQEAPGGPGGSKVFPKTQNVFKKKTGDDLRDDFSSILADFWSILERFGGSRGVKK